MQQLRNKRQLRSETDFRRIAAEIARRPSLRRLVALLLLAVFLASLFDFLRQAAGESTGADHRTAPGPGRPNRVEVLRLVGPGFALLTRTLRILRLRKPIALTFRRSDADVLGWTRIIPVDRDRSLAG